MAYSQKRIQALVQSFLEDIPRFRSTAEACKGIQELMAPALGVTSTELSDCVVYDETGELKAIVDEVSHNRLAAVEKRIHDLADGDIEVRPQSLTAAMFLLNNRHANYGQQRVQHSGTVQYVAPVPGVADADDAPPVVRLLKTGGSSGGGV